MDQQQQIAGQTSIEIQEPGIENVGKTKKLDTMLSLEDLIKNHAKSIKDLKSELKAAREMYEDSFNNNPTYREHADRVKEASKLKSSVRLQIAKQPSVAVLGQKMKDIRFDIREQQRTLDDLLLDYKEQTGATQLELFGGQTFELITRVSLVMSSKNK